MRSLFITLIATLLFSPVFAINTNPVDERKFEDTYKELARILNKYPNLEGVNKSTLVEVSIVLNVDNEIFVLKTNTTDSSLNSYIKRTLNNHVMESNELKAGRKFVFLAKFDI